MSKEIDNKHTFAILTDTTMCTGCETCVHACKQTYGLERDRAWRWKQNVDDLSSTRFTTITTRPGGHHVRRQCRHCLEPACVSACLVGALQKTPEGPVIYDEKRCMGCRYCMMACPYGVPRYKWESAVPVVRKCIMCYDRIKAGKQPACTEACPYGATIFGTREDMLAEAHRRIEAEPNKYYPHGSPKIYGEHDVGGTSVLYISDVNLDFLGWKPDLGDEPVPALTWGALRKVPPVAMGVAALMSGVYWMIGRRMHMQEMKEQEDVGQVPDDGTSNASES
ncbi:MAG TPA: 4Fe-4S dicluster domain-containing protein [Phycisphaerae bacterium]|nr:4Fe-4S dicluster domain-containing protein [Phycisphaerae bacterium]